MICKNAVKKLPFVIRYVPDWDKTQKRRDNVVLEMLENVNIYSWLLQKSKNVY